MSGKNALSLNSVSFRFAGTRELFFNNIDSRFSHNKLHFIRGRNGSGKSTLFRLLRGDIEHNEHISGEIMIGDTPINLKNETSREKLYHKVRTVEQKFDYMLADNFNFIENLQLAQLPQLPHLGTLPKHNPIPSFVSHFGINYKTPVSNLSGGQRQILAILMTLQKPLSILLLDEPTAALDDKNADMVVNFLQELLYNNKDLTVFIICHDKEIVEKYAGQSFYEIEVQEDDSRNIRHVTK